MVKPSAHLEAANLQAVTYQTNQGIFFTFFHGLALSRYRSSPVIVLKWQNWSVNKYRRGGVGWSTEGVGHYVFSLPNGVVLAIFSLGKGWVIIFYALYIEMLQTSNSFCKPSGRERPLERTEPKSWIIININIISRGFVWGRRPDVTSGYLTCKVQYFHSK